MEKKWMSLVVIAGLAGSMIIPSPAFAALEDFEISTTAEENKVIFDTDMGYLGDDAYAMCVLAQADAAGWIDLLGITSVGGNEICATGVNAILNQLEAIERTDIPVYIGTDIPVMGFRKLEEDQPITGGFQWTGAYRELENYVAPDSYHDLGELVDEEWGYSKTDPQKDMNAAEFLIKSVKENPGRVTIIAVGACTNVAIACMMDPTFAENTAGIIYMGGAIDVPGNANVCGEFNWFYDPEAVQQKCSWIICIRTTLTIQRSLITAGIRLQQAYSFARILLRRLKTGIWRLTVTAPHMHMPRLQRGKPVKAHTDQKMFRLYLTSTEMLSGPLSQIFMEHSSDRGRV